MSLSQGIGLEFDDNFKSMGAMEGWKKMPKKGPKNVKKKIFFKQISRSDTCFYTTKF